MSRLLTDEQIEIALLEAEKEYWSHGTHPRFEKQKHLLDKQAQLTHQETLKAVGEWVYTFLLRPELLGTLTQQELRTGALKLLYGEMPEG
jgi:hypothetical protein